ncbi:hypothetical protein E9K_09309, partial [Moraxella catarrhalis 103P14B1]
MVINAGVTVLGIILNGVAITVYPPLIIPPQAPHDSIADNFNQLGSKTMTEPTLPTQGMSRAKDILPLLPFA